MKSIKVIKINLEDILEKGKDRYNSNNNENIPNDYKFILTQMYFSKFKHLKDYKTFSLPIEKWMFEANKIGYVTGEFPKSYIEELDSYCKKYTYLDLYFDKPYFVRTENVSLKYGCNGKSAYRNIRAIIQSITTCPTKHSPLFVENIKELNIFLIEPVGINEDLEFRVFYLQ